MRSFKNILYFLAILYLVFNILLVFLLESIFQGLGEGNFLMLIPYWLSLGCLIILSVIAIELIQNRQGTSQLKKLEREGNELKARLYDMSQNITKPKGRTASEDDNWQKGHKPTSPEKDEDKESY